MVNDKTSIIFYCSWFEAMEDLTDEQIGQFIRGMMEYISDDIVPEFTDKSLKMAWRFVQPVLEADLNKWERTKEARAEAGRKGGTETQKRFKQNQANQANASFAQANQAKPSKTKQSQANQAVNVNDNVNVNVNDNVNVDVNENVYGNVNVNVHPLNPDDELPF